MTGSITPLVRAGKLNQQVPEELARPLQSVVRVLWFMSISAVVILVLAGFRFVWFSLPPSVLIAIVGGISLQYVAAIVSPLVQGITRVLIEQIRSGRS